MPYGERFRSASAGAVGVVDVAGGPRGAVPSRAASAARAATPIRAGSGGAPAGTAARLHRALRPARVAGGPPVGGRGGAGGSAGVAAGGPYDDDGALTQESQQRQQVKGTLISMTFGFDGHADWRKLENGPSECVGNPEVMFEDTAADASSCVHGGHIGEEGNNGGDESEDDEDYESDDDGDYESVDDDDGDYESVDDDDESDDDGDDESDAGGDEGPMSSTNLKRGRKTMSSAGPRKRIKSQMVKIMKGILETMQASSAVARKVMLGEHMAESIKQVMRLTVECGAAEGSIEHFMATKLFVKAEYRCMFLTISTNEARLAWLKRWCQEKKLYSLFDDQ
ncbi:hypothetical protein GQ55_7G309100 [Panicum hallii var. hallii]|uniref:Myb/SANT-like domain-containing protein n=1 Tax=Panicum hallii var. hallii TaxID=1504633 RepID=A0A2T7D0X3_9POAL|nr:hypothetical protein GQ55_7G309100 [Panicum hallii var. hallii]